MGDAPTNGNNGLAKAVNAVKDVTLPQAIVLGIISMLVIHFTPGYGNTKIDEVLSSLTNNYSLLLYRVSAVEAANVAQTSDIEALKKQVYAGMRP
ncbi:MAG: hypothetical protein AB7I42_24295 [Bradyrhizobium sp.]|uniref:hypothetical protein n=1 Tax=Bradyrhizobium sp. TaxID=376 RepID=UPI003D0BA850